jgi:uncharacterized protein
MKIGFGEISRAQSRFTIQEESWLPSGTFTVTSPVTAEISLCMKSADSVSLNGVLTGVVQLDCARCGDPVSYELNEEFLYLVTTREEDTSELPEKEVSDEECDTLYLKEPVIDVADILQEQMYLAIPGKVVCGDQCRGLCPGCGGSLNREECFCSESQPDTPFAILKKLKKD